VAETAGAGSTLPRESASQTPENRPSISSKTAEDCWYVADDEDPECAAIRASANEAVGEANVAPAPNAGEASVNYAEGEYELTLSVMPVYPARALSRGMQGYVDLQFTVTQTGTVKDPVVVSSTSTIFNRAATRTVLKYQYKPRVVNGQPIEVPGVTTRITFEIAD
jgi:protein TonB